MRKRFPTIVRVLLALALVAGLLAVIAAPVSAQTAVTAVGFTASPPRAGAVAQYVVGFTTSATGALTANVDTITITFPAQVTVPTTIAKAYVSVTSGGATNVTLVDPVVIGNTVILITPTAVANSAAATVTFAQVAGIKNPPLAAVANFYVGYVNTSQDTTPMASATYSAITTDVTFTPLFGPVGTAISVTGVGFAPSMSVDITDAVAVVIGTGTTLADGTFNVTAYAATTSTGTLTATDGSGNTHTTTATFTVAPAPATIYVPDHYPSIQVAVSAASPGDTIIVRDGTYTENVDVYKDHLTIQSENGAEVTIVQAATSSDPVFYVTADWVNITGFTVQNATDGISLDYANHCTVSDNNVTNNTYGIELFHSSSNTITNNTVSNNIWSGIYLRSSSSNTITSNTASNNTDDGIQMSYSSSNTLTNNTMVNDGIHLYGYSVEHWNTHTIDTSNKVNGKPVYYWKDTTGGVVPAGAGQVILANCAQVTVENQNISKVTTAIELGFCNDNTITNNTVWNNNRDAIALYYSSSNIITNNNASNNDRGIYLYFSNNNTLTNNTASNNNYYGIRLYSSNNNTLTNNTISNNNYDGINLFHSSSNTIYLNSFIDNTAGNVYSSSSTNNWNSPEEITYTYNGSTYTNHLGNYWSDYMGSDADGDGIGDSAYAIDGDSDNYPLMEPFKSYGLGDSIADLGNSEDEATHNLVGWGDAQGPPENPYVSPSGDTTKRYQTLHGDNSVDLWVEEIGVDYLLTAEVEDGACTDNFEIYVNGQGPIYTYEGKHLDNAAVVHEVAVPAAYVTEPQVTVTFRNTSTDDCGLAAVYNVGLAPAADVNPPDTEITIGPSGTIDYNDVTFTWTGSDDVTLTSDLVYSYYLDGYDSGWSAWTTSTMAEYLDLPDDDYTFRVRAKDQAGNIDPTPAEASFVVDVEWSFAIITDLHIGRGFEDYGADTHRDFDLSTGEAHGGDEGGFNCLTDRLADVVTWINENGEQQDIKFLVILGDIADTGEMSEIFRAKKLLDELTIPYIPIIGNHDVWSYTGDKEGLERSGDIYFESIFSDQFDGLESFFGELNWNKQEHPTDITQPYLQNYAFEYKGLDFICLDFANRDKDSAIAQGFEETKEWLEDNLEQNYGETVMVLSHYPFMVRGGVLPPERAYLDWQVLVSDTQVLSFGGHIHDYWNTNGLFQTPLGVPIIVTKGMMERDKDFLRIVNVVGPDTEDIDYGTIETPTAREIDDGPAPEEPIVSLESKILNWFWAKVESPVELRVYDSEGRVTGLVNGETKDEIPMSGYSEDYVIVFSAPDSYRYEIVGIGDGSYGLTVSYFSEDATSVFSGVDVPIACEARHQYTIDWDALSQGEEGVTLEIDADGDGVFEDTISSDGELTHDEFILQTATVIDFDPDVLCLKGKGKWITAYVELPEGWDVEDIDLSTVLLNEAVPAITDPQYLFVTDPNTYATDYDEDGILERLFKFDRSEVQQILDVGEEVEITITGEVGEVVFEGSDNIRVIGE